MPNLPKQLQVVWAVMAFIVCPSQHVCSLYCADDVTGVLGIAANIDGNSAISRDVDVFFLLHAFAHNAADEYLLGYSKHFNYPRDNSVMYVRKTGSSGSG